MTKSSPESDQLWPPMPYYDSGSHAYIVGGAASWMSDWLQEEGGSAVSVPGAIIPTSAITGKGIEDLSAALCQLAKANVDG